MRQLIAAILMVGVGLGVGVGLTEAAVRFVLADKIPSLERPEGAFRTADGLTYAPNTTLTFGGPNKAYQQAIALNKYGVRDNKDLAELTRDDWLAFGDMAAMGVGVKEEKRFSENFERLTGQKVYNVAVPGGSGYLKAMKDKMFQAHGGTDKAVFVVDMGRHLSVYENQHDHLDTPQKKQAYSYEAGFLYKHSALARLLDIGGAPKAPKLTYDQALVDNTAEVLVDAMAPYTKRKNSLVVLLVPARGHWLDSGAGAVHREYQEKMGKALRQFGNVFVVDIGYMLKNAYADPIDAYYKNGLLNDEGHRTVASGFIKQVEVFNEWHPTPPEETTTD